MSVAAVLAFALLGLTRDVGEEPSIAVRVGVADVELGEAFDLVVVRRRPAKLDVRELDPAAFAPLDVAVIEIASEVVGGVCVETVLCVARAWALGDVVVPAVEMRSGDGAESLAVSAPVPITVTGVLGEDAADVPELPGPALEIPPRRRDALRWLVAAIAGAAAALVVGRSRRRRRRADAAPPEPHEVARARIDRLGAALRAGDDGAALLARLADAVRDHVSGALGVPATARTTPEVRAALGGVVAADVAADVDTVLAAADGVKFGGGAPDASELERGLAAFAALVAATAPTGGDAEEAR